MANSTLTAVGLFGSATATSYVFLHNLGMSQYGLIPYLEGKVANVKLSASDKVKTWQSYYNAAMVRTLLLNQLHCTLLTRRNTRSPQLLSTLSVAASSRLRTPRP